MYHDETGHVARDKVDTSFLGSVKRLKPILEIVSSALLFPGKAVNTRISFETIHIGNFGPVNMRVAKMRKMRFRNLCDTIRSDSFLASYFQAYSRPTVIVSDRGSAFTSRELQSIVEGKNIKHIKIATASPQANGQVLLINRSLSPMVAKLTSAGTIKHNKNKRA